MCAVCHTLPQLNKKKSPCNDVNSCKLKDKHPELMTDICTIQRELKELEQMYTKVKRQAKSWR